jgi:hypothetical protein
MFDDRPCCGLDTSPETATVINVCNKIVAAIRQDAPRETLTALIKFAVDHREDLPRKDVDRLYGGVSYYRNGRLRVCRNGTITTLLGVYRSLDDAAALTDQWLDTGAQMFVPNAAGWTLLTCAAWRQDVNYLVFVVDIALRRCVSLNVATYCDIPDIYSRQPRTTRVMRTALDIAKICGRPGHVQVLRRAGALTYTRVRRNILARRANPAVVAIPPMFQDPDQRIDGRRPPASDATETSSSSDNRLTAF